MNPDCYTTDEQAAMFQCVKAIKELPIYAGGDFNEIFGLSKEELKEVIENYPNWNFIDEEADGYDNSQIAVNNALAWHIDGTETEKRILKKFVDFEIGFLLNLQNKFKNN